MALLDERMFHLDMTNLKHNDIVQQNVLQSHSQMKRMVCSKPWHLRKTAHSKEGWESYVLLGNMGDE